MSLEVWIAIGLVFVGTWTVIYFEFRRTPSHTDDYIDEEEAELREDPPPPNEKSPPKSQTYSDDRVYKHWEYPHTDCPCQMGMPVKKHTKDCQWMWENHGKNYQLSELQKRWEELKTFGSDEHIYQELHRIEREIQIIKGKQK